MIKIFKATKATRILSRAAIGPSPTASSGVLLTRHDEEMVGRLSIIIHQRVNQAQPSIDIAVEDPLQFDISVVSALKKVDAELEATTAKIDISFDAVKHFLEDMVNRVGLYGVGLALVKFSNMSGNHKVQDIAVTALSVFIEQGLYNPLSTQTPQCQSAPGPR